MSLKYLHSLKLNFTICFDSLAPHAVSKILMLKVRDGMHEGTNSIKLDVCSCRGITVILFSNLSLSHCCDYQ